MHKLVHFLFLRFHRLMYVLLANGSLHKKQQKQNKTFLGTHGAFEKFLKRSRKSKAIHASLFMSLYASFESCAYVQNVLWCSSVGIMWNSEFTDFEWLFVKMHERYPLPLCTFNFPSNLKVTKYRASLSGRMRQEPNIMLL